MTPGYAIDITGLTVPQEVATAKSRFVFLGATGWAKNGAIVRFVVRDGNGGTPLLVVTLGPDQSFDSELAVYVTTNSLWLEPLAGGADFEGSLFAEVAGSAA